jgi:hypothetical protein
LVYNNRPKKNLTFPKVQSVFLPLQAGTVFEYRLETLDSLVAIVLIRIPEPPLNHLERKGTH